jgi:ABC-2 type transport system ATP-binding protein
MLKLIRELRDTEGVHVMLSSHLLRDVEECCDEVFILKDGRVAAQTDLEAERRTNRKFLELETVGADETLAGAFEGIGCECAAFGHGRFKLVLPDGAEIRNLYRVAAEQNVQIRRMTYRRDSLEDIFLKAMESPSAIGAGNGSL